MADTPIYDELQFEISTDYWESYWNFPSFFVPPCAYDQDPPDAPCGGEAWERLRETWYDFRWPDEVTDADRV